MKNIEWPSKEVKRLAQSSGKPLEVRCAQEFLAAGWTTRLGSHFADGALDTVRELDLLATKEETLATPVGLSCRLRVLVSCRGFPPGRSPLTYSVSTSCVPSFTPRLLSGHRALRARASTGANYGPLPDLEEAAASRLLQATSLDTARPLVAFDMIERNETVKKKGKDKSETTVAFRRCADGDRHVFTAIDSSVKAAFYWQKEDYQSNEPKFIALTVPVCVLSMPFWDVCIDGGAVAEPEILHCGYQTHAYPATPRFLQATTFVWSAEALRSLVAALDDLLTWFCVELRSPEFETRWLPSF